MGRAKLIAIVLVAVAGVACVAAFASSAREAGQSDIGGTRRPPQLRLYPAVTLRGDHAAVTVTELDVPSLEVRLAGATTNLGHRLPWTPLRHDGGAWRGLLPAPEFRGIYPLELRIRGGSPIVRSERWLLRVFARGTQSRPSFRTPEGVARWWVETLPQQARLAAMRRWPQSTFDLRDDRRHRLLVVAYTLAGHRAVGDRLGMFVTAVRGGLHGRWRLLEASVAP
jgi:hypothetical protein